MTFKDYVAQDLNTFLGLEEFGEIVEIDEIKIKAILIQHTGDLNIANVASKHEAYYIHPELHNQPLIGNFVTVYFKTADYVAKRGRIPKHTEFTYINGVRYRVEESIDEMGITRLIATTDRMNTPPTPQSARLPSLYDN